jgi:hypothetical protein
LYRFSRNFKPAEAFRLQKINYYQKVMAKSGNSGGKRGGKGGGNKKKKLSETEEERAQRRAEEKLEKEKRELDNRRKYRPYLDKIDAMVCRMKYLYGMNLMFHTRLMSLTPPLSQRSKEIQCELLVSFNYQLTSEYHWIDSGVIQRPFDKITESIEIEDEQRVSVTSIQGFDALIRKSEFEEEMGDTREMAVYNEWREKFVLLENELFGYKGNIATIAKKMWGENFKNFKIDWPLRHGYRKYCLHLKVGKQNEDGWSKFFLYSPERHYSAFKSTKKAMFTYPNYPLHEAGMNYASHESILPKVKEVFLLYIKIN